MRPLAVEDVRQQTRIVKLVEEPFDRRDIERLLVVTPENLVPRNGRAVEQALRRHDHPLAAVVKRDERQQMLAGLRVPQKRAPVFARGREQPAIRTEIERIDVRRVTAQRDQVALRRKIPNLDRVVSAAGREQLAVTTKRDL